MLKVEKNTGGTIHIYERALNARPPINIIIGYCWPKLFSYLTIIIIIIEVVIDTHYQAIISVLE